MNALTITPEQFIFASENTLKTTSLKISERFGKTHSDVLRAIDKILTQVSDSFGERNFEPSDYEQENNLGLMTKYRSYDLTRDGFMIVVMSFTGKPAMAIKEWYINAFNLMAAQLQKPYGLKSLPPSPHISESEASQFKKSIEALCGGNRKRYSELYRKIYDYYEITGYKNIPAGKLEEAAKLISMTLLPLGKPKMPAEPFTLSFTPEELEDLVVERIKAFEGELLPRQEALQHNSITINLAPLNVDRRHRRWLVTQALDEMTVLMQLDLDQDVKTREQFIRDLIAEGYIVIKKSEVVNRLI